MDVRADIEEQLRSNPQHMLFGNLSDPSSLDSDLKSVFDQILSKAFEGVSARNTVDELLKQIDEVENSQRQLEDVVYQKIEASLSENIKRVQRELDCLLQKENGHSTEENAAAFINEINNPRALIDHSLTNRDPRYHQDGNNHALVHNGLQPASPKSLPREIINYRLPRGPRSNKSLTVRELYEVWYVGDPDKGKPSVCDILERYPTWKSTETTYYNRLKRVANLIEEVSRDLDGGPIAARRLEAVRTIEIFMEKNKIGGVSALSDLCSNQKGAPGFQTVKSRVLENFADL
ncbi:hypothetical protein KL918_000597 [Ogataea parapolymorpha]|uniref:Uncharacterized protein n=1 Tax=Ogataea parapolymorpha (strain ATCC 26012 / BCRC 20466 / JCM 22074 / NRRL Y-7560 / DL-1) TaxID=871575 RepID=W1Q890_OGAPD|nr:hypothetical protein HPODL_01102 [Ogataea parapolymorpha DL-1]ESW96986.1 hypothetical protein HPODL_01102 [Ogataea parapolymorpha DL-1]KAG7869052.1 hypothetical protein KL918_000597 [Ogataea parapolymorpha]KAG7875898.1 hypothetical protein KL916_000569 [Ogataea parapolymorpha]